MKPVNIYLCRHGQSVGNDTKEDLIGQPVDSPLTLLGRDQASLLAKRFLRDKISFDRCFASSFLRAAETAKIIIDSIGYKQPLFIYNELVEYSPGDWRGKNRQDIFNDIKNVRQVAALNMSFKFPNGEALTQTERRASNWLEEKLTFNKEVLDRSEVSEQHFLVVSHGMTIKCLLHYIMGFSPSFIWNINIDNSSITHIKYGERGYYLNCINDIGHLLNK